MNLKASDVKVFVPAKNFQDSLAFYTALGWKINFQLPDNSLAELELANSRFYLQNFYNKAWANNFMMQIEVEDAQAWHDHAHRVISTANWKHARLEQPKKEDYGAIVTYVWDPSGVLLHFTQRL